MRPRRRNNLIIRWRINAVMCYQAWYANRLCDVREQTARW